MTPLLRPTETRDQNAVLALFKDAFAEEDLSALVGGLLSLGDIGKFTAEHKKQIVGQIFFTPTKMLNDGDSALLGPLAISPQFQRQGLGKSLIEYGLSSLASKGIADVFVLGDPKFYGKFGFDMENTVTPPYPLPPAWAKAWQSVRNTETKSLSLTVPSVWQHPAFWS
jgi:predicted N-acetyltransferase YhbS